MAEALGALLRSRKFMVLLLDTAASLLLYFGGKYLGGATYDDLKFVIGLLQPVALMLIYAIATEDAAAIRAGRNLA
jgi:hypothetical protein